MSHQPRLRINFILNIIFFYLSNSTFFFTWIYWCMLYPNRIKIVIIYKNFFIHHVFFRYNFSKSLINRKEPEPEPQFVTWAPPPGGNVISAPRLRLRNAGIFNSKGKGKSGAQDPKSTRKKKQRLGSASNLSSEYQSSSRFFFFPWSGSLRIRIHWFGGSLRVLSSKKQLKSLFEQVF